MFKVGDWITTSGQKFYVITEDLGEDRFYVRNASDIDEKIGFPISCDAPLDFTYSFRLVKEEEIHWKKEELLKEIQKMDLHLKEKL